MNDTQSDKKTIKQILLRMYDSDVMLNKTGSYLHIGVSLDIALAEVRDILTEENPGCLGNHEKPLCLAEVEMNISNSLPCYTVILVWAMYIFFVHWARNADRKDLERNFAGVEQSHNG
ncbi:hypothetical protein DPMN_057911 [Dreissena polymorpha]|uniref:Uncharacterized protein n=1 Tax=Dreissena polymorpha TaxID=45954 RepID=A0A9D4HCS6_DREPO|nr:hypothetical protein DPMN_057911 [Dreissena polymorpha]